MCSVQCADSSVQCWLCRAVCIYRIIVLCEGEGGRTCRQNWFTTKKVLLEKSSLLTPGNWPIFQVSLVLCCPVINLPRIWQALESEGVSGDCVIIQVHGTKHNKYTFFKPKTTFLNERMSRFSVSEFQQYLTMRSINALHCNVEAFVPLKSQTVRSVLYYIGHNDIERLSGQAKPKTAIWAPKKPWRNHMTGNFCCRETLVGLPPDGLRPVDTQTRLEQQPFTSPC